MIIIVGVVWYEGKEKVEGHMVFEIIKMNTLNVILEIIWEFRLIKHASFCISWYLIKLMIKLVCCNVIE